MSTATSFSIVIPAYNYAHFLGAALDSVFAQSGLELEVIVVDDGSTDDTAELVKRYVQRDARLHYVYQDNQGPAAARARGLEESRYPWVLFLDADDELLPGALATFRDTIEANPGVGVLVASHLSDQQGRVKLVPAGPVGADRRQNFVAYLEKRISMYSGSCALHRSVCDELDFKTGLSHTEDMPLFAYLLANHDAVGIAEPVLKVRHHASSRRHDVDAALALGMDLESAIFNDNRLPDWAQGYRRYYRARRAISLLKLADRHRRPDQVRRFFHIALRADWRQALHPRYLRRYLASLIRGTGDRT